MKAAKFAVETLQDRDEFDHVQTKPFVCKKCREPLLDEHGVPLLKEADLAAWAIRMEAVMETAWERGRRSQTEPSS